MVKTMLTAATGVVLVAGNSGAKVMDLGREGSGTPYDRYMTPVKKVLKVSMRRDSQWNEVCRLLATARSFQYSHDTAYVASSPERTERLRKGDCKDKSLWLLAKMGSGNARFVIGKLREDSRIKHAWVYWESPDGEWYVLDPTHRSRPMEVAKVRSGMYVPYYSYAGNGVYLHDPTRPVVPESRVARVAEKPVETWKKAESDDSNKGWSLSDLFAGKDRKDEPVAEHNGAVEEKAVEKKVVKVVKVEKKVATADTGVVRKSQSQTQKAVVETKDSKGDSGFAARLSRLDGRGAI